jgi:CMP-N,N'-diacetyllegionaminic acid synthase
VSQPITGSASGTAVPRAVALIPARSGSKRVPGKNVRQLGDHPLIAYTIAAALDSGVYAEVVVSTDSADYAAIATHYGASVPAMRPAELASDVSPDIEWVDYTLRQLDSLGRSYDVFSILRPTSPFRLPATIRRAWGEFVAESGVDSLRAVEPCRQHPGKMWVVRGRRMMPLLPLGTPARPWHSMQYQALPTIHVQNASLEIAWSRVVLEGGSIAGEVVMPFLTTSLEGFDVNQPDEWRRAEEIVADHPDALPPVRQLPYKAEAI